jgi:phospholipase/carboxylesterase
MKTTALVSEWVPARQDSKKLIIVLHGRGDSPAGFRWMPEVMGLADVNYLLVRAPDRYYTGYSWYDLPPDQGPGIFRSRDLLDKLMLEVSAEGYRSEDTILFGFSQGCLMTLEWGGRTTLKFAGFVGISGYCYDPETLAKDMSDEARKAKWLITHGTRDGVLDYAVSEGQVKFLQAEGLPLEFHSFDKEHTIDDRDEMPMLKAWIKSRFLDQ